MQIKTTVRYHLKLVKSLLLERQEITSVGENVEKGGPMCTVGGNVSWCSYYGKQHGDASKN